MKIDGTEGIQPTPDSEKIKHRIEKPEQGFQEIFQKALKPDKTLTHGPAATTFVRPTIALLETARPVNGKDDVVKGVENLLDLLEDYSQQLMQPESQLKDIDAMVRKLDGQQKRLAPFVDQLPESDELKAILNQSLVTASVEIFKYHRGDYLAS